MKLPLAKYCFKRVIALSTLYICVVVQMSPAFSQLSERRLAEASVDRLSAEQAARFLAQSTMGATTHDVELVQNIGIRIWIERQLVIAPSHTEPYIERLKQHSLQNTDTSNSEAFYHRVMSAGNYVGYLNFCTAWIRAVLKNDDQLRQRVAWALSQILVVSNRINKLTEGTANYYDLLVSNAFSDYESLLLKVTYHPVMGRYLSYLGNRKANLKHNSFPDENYAREVLQLFTIGLWELNDDGTRTLDKQGNPIPTYSNEDVKELARVFTGFQLAEGSSGKINWDMFDQPMQLSSWHHDKGKKYALEGIINLSADQTPEQDIKDVIYALASHKNTAPFISTRLINHLVTSNPSPDYVKRVVQQWRESNGNLGAVVTAILLDPEARQPTEQLPDYFGRLRDPLTRLTSLLIAYECADPAALNSTALPGLQWWRPSPEEYLFQAPALSPTVFNFFDATYQQPGLIAESDLNSPEFQIYNDVTAVAIPNYFWQGLVSGFHQPTKKAPGDALKCDLATEQGLEIDALVDRVNLLSAAGAMTLSTRDIIKQHLQLQPNGQQRALHAVYMGAIAEESAVQR